MDPVQIEHLVAKSYESIAPMAVHLVGKLIGAVALWIVGRLIIRLVLRMVRRGIERRQLDTTLERYLNAALGVLMQILLVVAILGVFGVETTTFAGILAAAGVAIGMAWSGLLANFAAGVFLIMLSPFRVGDRISVAGVLGAVHEIGLFVTAIDTDDNVRVYVGNNKIFSDSITNFSTNTSRRVDMAAQLPSSIDPQDAISRLRKRLPTLPHVLQNPAPQVEINTFSMAGPVLLVRAYTHDKTYWDVYFAMTQAIADEFTQAGYPVPATHQVTHHIQLPPTAAK
jgi:small conductance mechanosensitive channel